MVRSDTPISVPINRIDMSCRQIGANKCRLSYVAIHSSHTPTRGTNFEFWNVSVVGFCHAEILHDPRSVEVLNEQALPSSVHAASPSSVAVQVSTVYNTGSVPHNHERCGLCSLWILIRSNLKTSCDGEISQNGWQWIKIHVNFLAQNSK